MLLDDDALAGGNAGGTGDDADARQPDRHACGCGRRRGADLGAAHHRRSGGLHLCRHGTGLNMLQGATLVMQVTLNTATGAYTVTQVAPIDHAAGR